MESGTEPDVGANPNANAISSEPGAAGVKLRQKTIPNKPARSMISQSQIYPSSVLHNQDDDSCRNRRRSLGVEPTSPLRESQLSNWKGSRVCSGLYNNEPIKMSGYLEKRSKMIGWKRFWFVLDGHLLTYYKSKADYESLSACCGSVNLGIATTVRPLQIRGCKGFPLQISTRSQIYYLRSLEKPILEKWLLALQETTSTPPEISSQTWTDPGVQFYRYSFASGSQWSLAASTDDISGSLSNFPKNFYLKRALASSSKSNPMKKCQSLASLHPGSLEHQPEFKNMIANPRLRLDPADSNAKIGRIRPSASMLVLESSTPQALELRKELTKKLSSGNLFKPQQKKDEAQTIPEAAPSTYQYDEIIDYEASCAKSSTLSDDSSSTSTTPSSEIYEPVQVSSIGSGSPWEKRIEYGNSNRNSLISISEVPESSQSEWKSSSMGRDIGQSQSRIIHQAHDELSSSSGSMSSSSFKKKKGIGGFFQKMFKKDEHKRKSKEWITESASPVNNNMVITGPIDLRSLMVAKQGHNYNKKHESVSNVKGQHIPQDVSKPKVSLTPVKNDVVMAELKTKVGQLKRANSEMTNQPDKPPSDPHPLTRRSTTTGDPQNASKAPGTILVTTPSSAQLQEILLDETNQNRIRKPSQEEYNDKLAKFNRLSAHLNPTFIAALNKSAINTANNVNVDPAGIGRSNSLSVKLFSRKTSNAEQQAPILPPKKRQKGVDQEAPAYDVPQNNKPVVPIETNESDSAMVNLSAFYANDNGQSNGAAPLRSLIKKNSAPDFVLPHSRRTSSTDSTALEIFHVHGVHDEGFPPPRAMKDVYYDSSLNCNCPISTDLDLLWAKNPDSSPPASTKSIDIDNLDALSDISSLLTTPPSTPFLSEPSRLTPNEAQLYSDGDSSPSLLDIKYATINTLVTELETVEETEDEMIELYDDFPSEFIPSLSMPREDDEEEDVFGQQASNQAKSSSEPRTISIKRSGIDELQKYLYSTTELPFPAASAEEVEDEASSGTRSVGAVNRLGHSAAIEKLHKLVYRN